MSKPPAITTLPFLILQVGQLWGKHNLNGQKKTFLNLQANMNLFQTWFKQILASQLNLPLVKLQMLPNKNQKYQISKILEECEKKDSLFAYLRC